MKKTLAEFVNESKKIKLSGNKADAYIFDRKVNKIVFRGSLKDVNTEYNKNDSKYSKVLGDAPQFVIVDDNLFKTGNEYIMPDKFVVESKQFDILIKSVNNKYDDVNITKLADGVDIKHQESYIFLTNEQITELYNLIK